MGALPLTSALIPEILRPACRDEKLNQKMGLVTEACRSMNIKQLCRKHRSTAIKGIGLDTTALKDRPAKQQIKT